MQGPDQTDDRGIGYDLVQRCHDWRRLRYICFCWLTQEAKPAYSTAGFRMRVRTFSWGYRLAIAWHPYEQKLIVQRSTIETRGKTFLMSVRWRGVGVGVGATYRVAARALVDQAGLSLCGVTFYPELWEAMDTTFILSSTFSERGTCVVPISENRRINFGILSRADRDVGVFDRVIPGSRGYEHVWTSHMTSEGSSDKDQRKIVLVDTHTGEFSKEPDNSAVFESRSEWNDRQLK